MGILRITFNLRSVLRRLHNLHEPYCVLVCGMPEPTRRVLAASDVFRMENYAL